MENRGMEENKGPLKMSQNALIDPKRSISITICNNESPQLR